MITRRLLLSFSFIATVILASMAFAGQASAATANVGIDHNGGAPNINPGPALVVEGGSVTVGVVGQAPAPGFGAWTIDVFYDDALLDASSCTPFFSASCNEDFASNAVRLSGASASGVSGTNTMENITFDALGTKGHCSLLRVAPSILTDNTSPDPVPFNPVITTNGSICIVGCADFNGDGRVGLADGLRLLFGLLLGRTTPAMDVNGDGDVDGRDFLLWRRQSGSQC